MNLPPGGSLQRVINLDPSPPDIDDIPDDEYCERFRNVMLNLDVPGLSVLKMYPPANVHAVVHDHHYLKKDQETKILDEFLITEITDAQVKGIEVETRGQSSNKAWREKRTTRLHSSNFGRICTATDATNFTKLAHSFTQYKHLNTEPIKHGKKYESVALNEYMAKTQVVVNASGIVVCRSAPYLACSPDGLVGDDGLVEVKCPYTARDDTVSPISVPYLHTVDGQLALKATHPYMYQVMGAMMCTGRQWCDFVVWSRKGHVVVTIRRDDHFISEMKARLNNLFTNHFRSAVLGQILYNE